MLLKEMLYSSDKSQLLKALEIIVKENKNSYAKDLFKLLKYEKDLFIQESIIYTLKHLNLDNISEDIYLDIFKEENILLKEFVLSLLSISKKVKVLGKLLESEDKDLRKYALDGLYRTNTNEAIELIAKCLDDPDINNQIAAIEYLGLLEAKEYAENIAKKLLNAKNPFLISTILETLSIIGNDITDKIVEDKFKGEISPYLYIPYSKYVFSRKNIFEGMEFFKKSENKSLILKEFLDFISKNLRIISLYPELKQEIYNLLSIFLKENISNKYEILIILDRLNEDQIFEILKSNIKHLKDADFIAALEIINERNFSDLKNEILKMELSEEVKQLIANWGWEND
ncbi:hypothetical protein JCM30566_08960 [Marinitoga arctica]